MSPSATDLARNAVDVLRKAAAEIEHEHRRWPAHARHWHNGMRDAARLVRQLADELDGVLPERLYIHAPFTPEQVQALHAYQDSGSSQPFTCPNAYNGSHHLDERVVGQLVATKDGWVCRDCDFEQDWARAFMADPKMTAWAQEVLGRE